MDDAKLRSTILATMADLATALLHDDRTDDEDLPRGAIQDALDAGKVDLGEMLEVFADELGTQLGVLIYLDVMCGAKHRYYSTHCRHGRHEDCSANTLSGIQTIKAPLGDGWLTSRTPVSIERTPACCKTCQAPCRCPCGHGAH